MFVGNYNVKNTILFPSSCSSVYASDNLGCVSLSGNDNTVRKPHSFQVAVTFGIRRRYYTQSTVLTWGICMEGQPKDTLSAKVIHKDKLEDMDVSLFASAHMGPWFSQGHCDQTGGPISNPRVPNERYGYHLSTDTFCFIVGWVVWSQCIVKVEYFLTFSVEQNILLRAENNFLKTFFQNLLNENSWNQLLP